MIVPEMGTKSDPRGALGRGLAGALFTPVQGRVLGLLFGQPERRFGSAEIIRLARGGTGAVHRQLVRLAAAGLVTVVRIGNQKHYRANRDSPVFAELHGLVVKTVGLVGPLREALSPLAKKIELAFVFGSVARGTETARSDVDLLVISDELGYAEVYEALQGAEQTLARKIEPTVWTRREWDRERRTEDSFGARILRQPRIFVIGDEGDAG
jgi:predicted nucleotidyltransferase